MRNLSRKEAGHYRVLGRKGWTVTRAGKETGTFEAWQIPGWWYLEGPGGVFHETETLGEMVDELMDRIRPNVLNGGWALLEEERAA